MSTSIRCVRFVNRHEILMVLPLFLCCCRSGEHAAVAVCEKLPSARNGVLILQRGPLRLRTLDGTILELQEENVNEVGVGAGSGMLAWDDEYWYVADSVPGRRGGHGGCSSIRRLHRDSGSSGSELVVDEVCGLTAVASFEKRLFLGAMGAIRGSIYEVASPREMERLLVNGTAPDGIRAVSVYSDGLLFLSLTQVIWMSVDENVASFREAYVSRRVGDAVISDGEFYVADRYRKAIVAVDSYGARRTLAENLDEVSAVARFGRYLYFMKADSADIWRLDVHGGAPELYFRQTTTAGNESLGIWANRSGLFWVR